MSPAVQRTYMDLPAPKDIVRAPNVRAPTRLVDNRINTADLPRPALHDPLIRIEDDHLWLDDGRLLAYPLFEHESDGTSAVACDDALC